RSRCSRTRACGRARARGTVPRSSRALCGPATVRADEMTSLVHKILALHRAVMSHHIPHAFGGALALAWCTQRARGTIDIDLNVFLGGDRAEDVVAALPPPVSHSKADTLSLQREGQARLWWQDTPVDLFLSTTEYHDEVARRVHWEP